MLTVLVLGFLAGLIAGISPCILPVLPVVLTAGTTGPVGARSRRPYGVVAGLVLSFSLSVLFGSVVLRALHLPADLLRDAGVVVLALTGLGLIWRRLGDLLARPFARLRPRGVRQDGGGFVLGLGLGLVFVPCAGPVLATISVVGASHRVGVDLVALTVAFALGVAVPLLGVALAGDTLVRRTGLLRRHAARLRVTGGVAMLIVAVTVGLSLSDGVARSLPGYASALQEIVEANDTAIARLDLLAPVEPAKPAATCTVDAPTLQSCGQAAEFTGLGRWFNTPGDTPLTLAGLRGRVVLVDFWTFACINCQRTLPYVKAWYAAYHDAGLEIVGIHTPEFSFERVPANVRDRSRELGVKYPVAMDNDYGTWHAYHNRYWPAEYLVDAGGTVRQIHAGEGAYDETENMIRELLTAANPTVALPPRVSVDPDSPQI